MSQAFRVFLQAWEVGRTLCSFFATEMPCFCLAVQLEMSPVSLQSLLMMAYVQGFQERKWQAVLAK